MKEVQLKFEELVEGLIIEDWWGYPGTVIKCDDIHDVIIDFDNEGKVHFCLAGDYCDENKVSFPIYNTHL